MAGKVKLGESHTKGERTSEPGSNTQRPSSTVYEPNQSSISEHFFEERWNTYIEWALHKTTKRDPSECARSDAEPELLKALNHKDPRKRRSHQDGCNLRL